MHLTFCTLCCIFHSLSNAPKGGLHLAMDSMQLSFIRNLTLLVYCPSLTCFISCYPICDREPTKNSFQLRLSSPCNIILEKSHFALSRKHLACLTVPSPWKKHKHWVIWQFGRGWWQTLNEISAVNQSSFATILTWTGGKMLQGWGRWGRDLCSGSTSNMPGAERYAFHVYYHVQLSGQPWEVALS